MNKQDTRSEKSEEQGDGGNASRRDPKWMYLRFAGMIATSTAVMFVLTYTNVFAVTHIHFSQERFYMAILMGAAMAIVMMAWMWKMHPNSRINVAIIGGAAVVGVAAFLFSQTQTLVYDSNYMRAMIPHHSIAILTSERSTIRDARVDRLACEIITAQRREIAEMEWLIADIADNGVATTKEQAEARAVPSFEASC